MNKLHGHITKISKVDDLSLIEIDVEGYMFKSIIIDDIDKPNYNNGDDIDVFFKETEVIISTNLNVPISMQNQLICKVKSIKKGRLLSEMKLDFNSIDLIAIITTNSLMRLKVIVGDEVLALIKTNQVMLSKC